METKDIAIGTEVIETAEGVAKATSGKAFKVAVGVGLVALYGLSAYQLIARPIIAKMRAKKWRTATLKAADEGRIEEIEVVSDAV